MQTEPACIAQVHQFSLHFERVGLRKCRCACPVSLHFYCHMGGRRSYANRCVQSEVKRGVAQAPTARCAHAQCVRSGGVVVWWSGLVCVLYPTHNTDPKRIDPKRSPTATLMVLSSMRSPKDETGRAFSHAPDSLAETANCRVRATSWGHSAKGDPLHLTPGEHPEHRRQHQKVGCDGH